MHNRSSKLFGRTVCTHLRYGSIIPKFALGGIGELKAINYDKRSLGPLVALAAVMLLASVLRFYGLEIQSLRFDELETWRYAIKSPPGILEATGVNGSDPHPPGYYLFIHYWMRLAGDAEWALRLPSAVAGVLSVLVTFLLGRRLYSAREGLIAALGGVFLLAANECGRYSTLYRRAGVVGRSWLSEILVQWSRPRTGCYLA